LLRQQQLHSLHHSPPQRPSGGSPHKLPPCFPRDRLISTTSTGQRSLLNCLFISTYTTLTATELELKKPSPALVELSIPWKTDTGDEGPGLQEYLSEQILGLTTPITSCQPSTPLLPGYIYFRHLSYLLTQPRPDLKPVVICSFFSLSAIVMSDQEGSMRAISRTSQAVFLFLHNFCCRGDV
jgi:hypothetical protein